MRLEAWADELNRKIRSPLAIVLGAPGQIAGLVTALAASDIVCYQMDLHQADRLRDELTSLRSRARVVASSDLWDLPDDFQTVVLPAQKGGERELKIDMVEQAFHILRPGGVLLVVSPFQSDQFIPRLVKKIFGNRHATSTLSGTLCWAETRTHRPRRRHELTFHVRLGSGPSLSFLSRPGVFSYGRFDQGARALVETIVVNQGDRILDIGCGCGTNGIIASLQSGASGSVAFLDSNLRALAVAEENARANGLTRFELIPSASFAGVPESAFDMAIANPPYYARAAIASHFIEHAHRALKQGGRFYLVTKQLAEVAPLVEKRFGGVEAIQRRGYMVLRSTR
jgi:16S rRNA (guanine1207-N2)-methyltransferase